MESEQKQTLEKQVFPSEKSGNYSFPLVLVIFGVFNIIFFAMGYYIGTRKTGFQENRLEVKKSKVEDALENNSEFRKIHDFLQRENPMEFKVPELPKK